MGKVKQKAVDVLDMLENGYDAEDIALILDVDLEFIKSVAGTALTSENTDFYGEFDE
jgi:hypothetical protein